VHRPPQFVCEAKPHALPLRPRGFAIAGLIAMHQVLDSNLVSARETGAVGAAIMMRHRRMPVLIAVVNVGTAVIFGVAPRTLNTIVKPSALYFAQLRRRRFPSRRRPLVSRRWRPLCNHARRAQSRNSHCSSQNQRSVFLHRFLPGMIHADASRSPVRCAAPHSRCSRRFPQSSWRRATLLPRWRTTAKAGAGSRAAHRAGLCHSVGYMNRPLIGGTHFHRKESRSAIIAWSAASRRIKPDRGESRSRIA
jgi:hypothetical protein